MTPTPLQHPITAYRAAHDLTPSEFAKLAGVERTSLAHVESGRRDRLGQDANMRIEEATKGALKARDLAAFKWPEPVPTPPAVPRRKRAVRA